MCFVKGNNGPFLILSDFNINEINGYHVYKKSKCKYHVTNKIDETRVCLHITSSVRENVMFVICLTVGQKIAAGTVIYIVSEVMNQI